MLSYKWELPQTFSEQLLLFSCHSSYAAQRPSTLGTATGPAFDAITPSVCLSGGPLCFRLHRESSKRHHMICSSPSFVVKTAYSSHSGFLLSVIIIMSNQMLHKKSLICPSYGSCHCRFHVVESRPVTVVERRCVCAAATLVTQRVLERAQSPMMQTIIRARGCVEEGGGGVLSTHHVMLSRRWGNSVCECVYTRVRSGFVLYWTLAAVKQSLDVFQW